MNKRKVIILSGPSCVGKTPLIKAFHNLYPQQVANLKKLVLYNSRSPRPFEKDSVDYYFSKRTEIENLLNKDNFIVMEVRGDLQAFDINELKQQLENNDVFFEGNTYIAKILLKDPLLKDVNKLSIFLSPFSQKEVLKLKSDLGEKGFEKYVFETMKTKLVRRAEKFKQQLTDKVLENLDQRASDAYTELKDAWMFDFVIPNHDGEESENWNEPIPPDSEAYLAVKEFSILLYKKKQQISEKWYKDLFI